MSNESDALFSINHQTTKVQLFAPKYDRYQNKSTSFQNKKQDNRIFCFTAKSVQKVEYPTVNSEFTFLFRNSYLLTVL